MDERPADSEYDWPCDRHYAHGPHPREPKMEHYHLTAQPDCPGVGAHPNTMIGRNDVALKNGGQDV